MFARSINSGTNRTHFSLQCVFSEMKQTLHCRDETYGNVKKSGCSMWSHIVWERNIRGRNVQGRIIPVPLRRGGGDSWFCPVIIFCMAVEYQDNL
jgi:hypothetical protein